LSSNLHCCPKCGRFLLHPQMPNTHKTPAGDLCLLHVTFLLFFHLLSVQGMADTGHTDSSSVGQGDAVDWLPAGLGNSVVGARDDMVLGCHIG